MSIKEKIQRIKESLDADAFQDGFLACAALLEGSGGVSGLPAAIQFALSSSYGLCALRTGRFDLAEEYCLLADSMESPPVQSQKNLKVCSINPIFGVDVTILCAAESCRSVRVPRQVARAGGGAGEDAGRGHSVRRCACTPLLETVLNMC